MSRTRTPGRLAPPFFFVLNLVVAALVGTVHVEAAATGRVQGTVADEKGASIGDLDLRFVPADQSGNAPRKLKVKAGRFAHMFFPAGRYTIELSDPQRWVRSMAYTVNDADGNPVTNQKGDADPQKGLPPFTVAAGQSVTLALVVGPREQQQEMVRQLSLQQAVGPLRRAKELYDAGDFAGALLQTDRVLKDKPDIAAGHFLRGVALARMNRFDDAIVALRRSLELDPKQASLEDSLGTVLLQKAQALAAAGKKDEARPLFGEAADHIAAEMRNTGSNGALRMKRAAALDQAGRTDELEAALREMLAAPPQEGTGAALGTPGPRDAALRLVTLLLQKNREEEALQVVDRHLGSDPAAVPVVYNAAVAQFNEGRIDQAITLARKAMAMDPRFALPHRLLGRAYLSQDKTDLALEELRTFVRMAPDDPEVKSEKELIDALEKHRNVQPR